MFNGSCEPMVEHCLQMQENVVKVFRECKVSADILGQHLRIVAVESDKGCCGEVGRHLLKGDTYDGGSVEAYAKF